MHHVPGLAPTRAFLASIAPAIIALASGILAARDSEAGFSLVDRRLGVSGMPSPAASVLVDCFERFLRDNDVDRFRRDVYARYTEGTLARLTRAEDVRSRRASVLSLGLSGSFGSNATVARTLKDPDPIVRSIGTNALWSIWCRADSPENNEELASIRSLIDREQLDEAIRRADRLTARSPTFAEAYNQRAIAHYMSGRLAESAADCRRTLDLNPYHIGALSGLGQCQIGLGRRSDAARTFRRALELQPYSQGLRQTVVELEGAGD